MTLASLKKIKIPDKPGVYFFLKGKEIIYIGKATSLKDRVKSYFGHDLLATRGPIILDMLFKADKVDWKTTDSVLEALILEASLIKKHQPKYNTKEKSDKSFNYVCITKEEIPKIAVLREKVIERERFSCLFGPFTNSSQLREAMKIVRPIFPYLDDKSKNYYKFYRQVGLVPDISSEEGIKNYKKNIKNLKLFFEGKKKTVIKNLEREMKELAKQQKFEKASEAKRQVFALKHINDVALLKNQNKEGAVRIEAYDIAHMGGGSMVGVMVVIEGGESTKDAYRKFKIRTQTGANDTGALNEVLERRLAHTEWPLPSLIVVDGGKAQINVAKKALVKAAKLIPVVSVLKDERHKPKSIEGDKKFALTHEKDIILANSEAHRFAINYHKNLRAKNFLK